MNKSFWESEALRKTLAMYKATAAIGLVTILLTCPHPTQAQSASSLSGTQPRTVSKETPTTPTTVFRTNSATDTELRNANGIPRRARIGERVDLVRDRQGGERRLGVFPQGSPNNEDEVQVEYQLQQ